MYTKNLLSYNYNASINTIIIRKNNLIKILFLLLFLAIVFLSITHMGNIFENNKNCDILVAAFKTDISMLSETADVLEEERTANKYLETNPFGSDGRLVSIDEIKPDLSANLIKIADANNDGKIDDEEITELGIMRLQPDMFQKELREFQFNLKSPDHNLKNFLIITKGKYAGTILYNGSIKFIDNENNRYFGVELFN